MLVEDEISSFSRGMRAFKTAVHERLGEHIASSDTVNDIEKNALT